MLSVRQQPRSKRVKPHFPRSKLQFRAKMFISPHELIPEPRWLPLTTLGEFLMRSLFKRRTGSHIAMAIALSTGAAVGVAGFAEPAFAQKKKKKGEEEAPQNNFTKEFVAAYQPVAAMMGAEAPDLAGAKAALPSVAAQAITPDDKFAVSNLTYTVGTKLQDMQLQSDGIRGMLASGKVPVESVGQYNFLAAQLAYQLKDYAGARTYAMAAIEAGYSENSPEVFVAESYLQNNEPAMGLDYLARAVQSRLDAGKTVDESWVRRGLAIAYNGKLSSHATQFGYWYASMYPSKDSWGDAIAVLRNFGNYELPEKLDILRLTRKTKTFRTKYDYHDYIEAADPRRLPGEVVAVADEGFGSGILTRDDPFVSEAYSLAQDRAKADRTELPALERDANAAGANLRTVVAAGDTFLSYGDAVKAEAFYTKSLAMPGVDTPVVLTRLGIAQVNQGKMADAAATFAKVQGTRQSIARLWAAYAKQHSAPVAAEAAPAPAA